MLNNKRKCVIHEISNHSSIKLFVFQQVALVILLEPIGARNLFHPNISMHLILSSVDFIFPKMLTIIICLISKCLFNLVSDNLLYSYDLNA